MKQIHSYYVLNEAQKVSISEDVRRLCDRIQKAHDLFLELLDIASERKIEKGGEEYRKLVFGISDITLGYSEEAINVGSTLFWGRRSEEVEVHI